MAQTLHKPSSNPGANLPGHPSHYFSLPNSMEAPLDMNLFTYLHCLFRHSLLLMLALFLVNHDSGLVWLPVPNTFESSTSQ